jgi:hypothetical protein
MVLRDRNRCQPGVYRIDTARAPDRYRTAARLSHAAGTSLAGQLQEVHMHKRWIMAAASLMVAAIPFTASASNSVHFRWHDQGNGTVDFCPFDPTRFAWATDVSGTLTGVIRGDGIAYFTEAVIGDTVFTDTVTGRSSHVSFVDNSHDLKIVDNGDGTITITTQGSGSTLFFDSGGKLVLSDTGMVRWSVLIDHGGTLDNPLDDVFIADLGIVKPSTGTNDTDGRDFCDDLLAYT